MRVERNNKVINLYQQGMSMASVAKEVGVSPATVKNILDLYNIPTRNKGGSSESYYEKIPDMYYRQKLTLSNISELIGVSVETVRNVLKRNGDYKANSLGNYNDSMLNESYFEEINTEAKAYLLGFLIADGNITDRNQIRLMVQKRDRYVLDLMKREINSTCKIQEDTRGCVCFSITSKKMVDDLSRYGVVPRKTNISYLPQIDKMYMRHLIRGLIDGDGWVSLSKRHNKNHFTPTIGFCGCSKIVNDVLNYLVMDLKITQNKVSDRDTWYQISWSSEEDCRILMKYLYKDSTCYLERKKSKLDYLI